MLCSWESRRAGGKNHENKTRKSLPTGRPGHNEIRGEILKRIEQTEGIASAAKGGVEGLNGRLTRAQDDLDDMAEGRKNLDRRTADAIKQHKEALRSLYEYAQKASEIRSNMLQKITDLERCAQAHEAWITEQEEKQWKD